MIWDERGAMRREKGWMSEVEWRLDEMTGKKRERRGMRGRERG